MAVLPGSDRTPLVRTDFSDDAAWQALLGEIGDGWVVVVDDPAYRGLSVADLVALVPDSRLYPVLVIADDFSAGERTVLLVDVVEEPGRTLRATPEGARSMISNLSIQNRTFDDYIDSAGASGVYQLSDRHRQALAALGGFSSVDTSRAVALGRSGSVGEPAQPGRRAEPAQPGQRAEPARRSVPPEA
ncbi:DUF6924 domain-containing protein [Amycolatopsis sacchari]|uniref:DUF6924 domain-containing protein n=1 Tax=Amycolatopsis sacchari TaxID=115433 RepID=UPI003D747283